MKRHISVFAFLLCAFAAVGSALLLPDRSRERRRRGRDVARRVYDGGDACGMEVGHVFGGGNLADLSMASNKVTVNVRGADTKVGSI